MDSTLTRKIYFAALEKTYKYRHPYHKYKLRRHIPTAKEKYQQALHNLNTVRERARSTPRPVNHHSLDKSQFRLLDSLGNSPLDSRMRKKAALDYLSWKSEEPSADYKERLNLGIQAWYPKKVQLSSSSISPVPQTQFSVIIRPVTSKTDSTLSKTDKSISVRGKQAAILKRSIQTRQGPVKEFSAETTVPSIRMKRYSRFNL
jgi:hypothetical protein